MGRDTGSDIAYRGVPIFRQAGECRWTADVPAGEGYTRIEAETAPELLAAIDETLDRRRRDE